MKTNVVKRIYTHEGAPAKRISTIDELRRSVMACLLWEDTFYENGQTISDRIKTLVAQCDRDEVAALAIEAREKHRLRHVPLLLVRELARKSKGDGVVSRTLNRVIQRPDELAEFLSIYWKDGRVPLSKQVKKGLAYAFRKFDEYQLAKYNRDTDIKLRDVLFMVHAKPRDEEQAALWKRLVDNQLATPDTWEVSLSGGGEKAETFTRLLTENKLGYMALLRNLRNMQQSGVNKILVEAALKSGAEKSKALPFRYIAAASAVPQWEPMIDEAMMLSMKTMTKLTGRTLLLLDHSGSMDDKLSGKSDLKRRDAAAGLAILLAGVCDDLRIVSFSTSIAEVPPRKGMAMRDAYYNSMSGWRGTQLGAAVRAVDDGQYDRMIVITDEQSSDRVPDPKGKAYMINVACNKNGVGYGKWTHIDGFSEAVMNYIQAVEAELR